MEYLYWPLVAIESEIYVGVYSAEVPGWVMGLIATVITGVVLFFVVRKSGRK